MRRKRFTEEQIIGILKEHVSRSPICAANMVSAAAAFVERSAPAPVATTAQQGKSNSRSELTTG